MGLHHQANHGRVFRGVDAKKHLQEKRDSHGSNVVMHVPVNNKAAARPADPAQTNYGLSISLADKDVQTVESVVYVTMSADFTGSVGGYTTLTDVAATSTAASTAATTSASVNDAEASYLAAKASASAGASTSSVNAAEASYLAAKSSASAGASTASTITVSPTSSAASSTGTSTSDDGSNNKSNFLNPVKTTATSSTAAATVLVGAGVQATHSATATSEAQISQDSTGMTGGAKAGLAIGIILAIALAGGLLFFCWRRRRNPKAHEELLDEKRTSSIFGGKAMSEKHASIGSEHRPSSIRSAISTAPRLSLRPASRFLPSMPGSNRNSSSTDLAAAAMSEKPKSMWERRSNATENPFDDAAVTSEKNPFDEPEGNDEKAAHRHSKKSSWEGSEPATPKSTKFGTATAIPVTAPAVPQGPNNVHRVQLDFKPSMEDELELKSGQLVRMLHEYDDGWVSFTASDPHARTSLLTRLRLSASGWTARSRVSPLVPACPNSQSSRVRKAHPPTARTPAQ